MTGPLSKSHSQSESTDSQLRRAGGKSVAASKAGSGAKGAGIESARGFAPLLGELLSKDLINVEAKIRDDGADLLARQKSSSDPQEFSRDSDERTLSQGDRSEDGRRAEEPYSTDSSEKGPEDNPSSVESDSRPEENSRKSDSTAKEHERPVDDSEAQIADSQAVTKTEKSEEPKDSEEVVDDGEVIDEGINAELLVNSVASTDSKASVVQEAPVASPNTQDAEGQGEEPSDILPEFEAIDEGVEGNADESLDLQSNDEVSEPLTEQSDEGSQVENGDPSLEELQASDDSSEAQTAIEDVEAPTEIEAEVEELTDADDVNEDLDLVELDSVEVEGEVSDTPTELSSLASQSTLASQAASSALGQAQSAANAATVSTTAASSSAETSAQNVQQTNNSSQNFDQSGSQAQSESKNGVRARLNAANKPRFSQNVDDRRTNLVKQVAKAINLRAASKADGHMNLLLRPEHLGTLRIRLEFEDNGLRVDALAESNATRHLLAASSDDLRVALRQENITLSRFNVETGAFFQGAEGGSESGSDVSKRGGDGGRGSNAGASGADVGGKNEELSSRDTTPRASVAIGDVDVTA